MHGVLVPTGADAEIKREHRVIRARAKIWEYRWFLGIVVLPTLLIAAYYFLIASDQYESEAHFVVREAETSRPVSNGLSMLAAFGGERASPEATSVADYMTSHDVVQTLNTGNRLVQRYSRPHIDPLYRLADNPSPERLLKYFLSMNKVEINGTTGIVVLRARAFTPQDAYSVASELLTLGDKRINTMNSQAYTDAVSSSQRQVDEAERALEQAQQKISAFRASRRDIDPTGTGTAQTQMVSQMTVQVSAIRAQLQSMRGAISTSSPQYVALSRRLAAMEAQLAQQSGRLAGEGPTIASQVADYNELELRQEFAAKRYAAAAAGLDGARDQAAKKRLYLVRVVNPNLPGKALFPQRFRIVGTIFISLLLAYGIGWLLVAGVREHAN
jgi:capsular polysaccharide transport system permease protein